MSARDRFVTCLLFGLFTVGVAAAAGCSLRYDFTECESDAECRALEEPAEGVFYTCAANNRCQRQEIECRNDTHCTGEGGVCRSNRCVTETADAGGGDTRAADAGESDATTDARGTSRDTSADTVDRRCEHTLECRNRFGNEYVCAPTEACRTGDGGSCGEGTCIKATTERCSTLYYPPDTSPEAYKDVVLLGSIVPESEPLKEVGRTLSNAIQLAVREWEVNARGLPSGETVAWLQCDNEAKQSASIEAAEHLVRLGVPAIVGPIRSGNYLDVVETVTADAGVVSIAPAATAPSISKALPAAGKSSFRIIGGDQLQARALLDRLETLLKRRSSFEVTVFYKNDRYGRDFQTQLSSAVGDADWIGSNDITYLQTIDSATNDKSAVEANFGTKVSEALQQQPGADAVVFVGTSEMIPLAATYIEGAFSETAPDSNPETKRYVFSHGAVPSLPDLPAELDGNETFVPLTEGVSPNVIQRDNFPDFVSRYNTIFDEDLTVNSAGTAYDAALLAILGMAGVPSGEPITGPNVAKVVRSGMLQDKKAPSERRISFDDPVNFGKASQLLGNGKTIDVTGVSGDLDLNDQGSVRPNYVGIDSGIKLDINDNPVYDIIPARLWQVNEPPKLTGTWNPVPPGITAPGTFEPDFKSTPIPDDDPKGVTRTIEVQPGDCGTTNSVGVGMDVEHPAPEELKVTITSPATGPNGNPIEVLLRDTGKTQPLEGEFPKTLIPNPTGTDYASLLAKNGAGTWELQIVDTSSGNTGTLKRWSLRLFCN